MTIPPQESLTILDLRRVNPARKTSYRYNFDWAIGDREANHDDDYVYAFPYEQGKRYRVVQGYGSRFSHTGLEQFTVDFDMPVGTAVHAAAGKKAVASTPTSSSSCTMTELPVSIIT